MVEQVALDGALADCAAVRASTGGYIGSAGDKMFAAPIVTVMRHVSIPLAAAVVAKEDFAAARADDFTAKEVQKIAILRPGLIARNTLLGLPEGIGGDDGRAEVVDTVAPAGVRLIAQDTADAAARNRDAVLREDVVRDPHR